MIPANPVACQIPRTSPRDPAEAAARALVTLSDAVNRGANNEVDARLEPCEVTPVTYRQPRTQSAMDPDAPTRRFGSGGHRDCLLYTSDAADE